MRSPPRRTKGSVKGKSGGVHVVVSLTVISMVYYCHGRQASAVVAVGSSVIAALFAVTVGSRREQSSAEVKKQPADGCADPEQRLEACADPTTPSHLHALALLREPPGHEPLGTPSVRAAEDGNGDGDGVSGVATA